MNVLAFKNFGSESCRISVLKFIENKNKIFERGYTWLILCTYV